MEKIFYDVFKIATIVKALWKYCKLPYKANKLQTPYWNNLME